MKNLKFVMTTLLMAVCVSVVAQNPVSVLSDGDVDKFIKTVKPMTSELEALGFDTSGEGSEELMEAMQTNAQVMGVIKKHGWDPNTISVKWMSITMCYAKLKLDEQMAMLPSEQREQMKEMMKQTGQNLDDMVNAEDLKKVKAKASQLDALMQEQ